MAKFRSKKFSMSGQINNWHDKVEPDSKQESSRPASVLSGTTQSVPCSMTSKLSCTTAATIFPVQQNPPLPQQRLLGLPTMLMSQTMTRATVILKSVWLLSQAKEKEKLA
jgi:hypothetical protein